MNPPSNKVTAPQDMLLEDFMQQILYDPVNGYYTKSKVIGKEQDFITAPELTPLFSHCIAQWCIDQWTNFGQPKPINLIELGAGQGTMLKDILYVIQKVPDLYNNLTIYILEKSETLKLIQQHNLQSHHNIHWIESLNAIEYGYSILLANEFFDALPIQYYRHNNGLIEEAIVLNQQAIGWRSTNISDPINSPIFLKSSFYERFVYQIAMLFKRTGGIGLIIDYGNDDPGFTLQAIRNHKKIGFFDDLGQADLTHHVDFNYLKRLFQKHHINVLGPQRQSDFLTELGISDRLEFIRRKLSSENFAQHALAAHRLTSASEMGELFKVIAIQGNNHGY